MESVITFGLYNKWDGATGNRSIIIQVTSAGHFNFYLGYNGGASAENIYDAGSLVSGRWYHYGLTFDNADKSWKIVVWDDTALAKVINASGTSTNNISAVTTPLIIGARYDANLPIAPFDGEKDEVVVFKDILTTGEIDQIRQGTYS